ncbi:helix-turn-helix domain-containing protein [Cellulosilyticum lentocellum]|uniref:Helix-turn-helix domain protein n=1 Tax=Cellulosilyticum lentocellum (strain ATCC 49066 / DSM 5427 / NCIMB 11756 / RHM5) TaxID=642492 RepID=F2JJ40_CELLD|nr:helix-turn-helix transcriptional regulator [Cellulosilyticum lentocellum]ADZ83199.1 helix-turn-helix domain protein [Cellulosilyticum lentocellum DSM 5427]
MGINDFIQIGTRIKEIRKSKGFSQAYMAEKIGVNRTTYSNYENNNREPNLKTIEKICEILDVTISDIVSDTQKNITVDYWRGMMDTDLNSIKEIEENTRGYSGLEVPISSLVGSIYISLNKNEKDFVTRYSYHTERLLESLSELLTYSNLPIKHENVDKNKYLDAINAINEFIKYKLHELTTLNSKEGE